MPHANPAAHPLAEPNSVLQRCQTLLGEVNTIKKDLDLAGEPFNLFKVLKIHADEVRLHSRFLAELLNPRGTHQQGGKFLALFIQQFFPSFVFNTETAKVKIEQVIDDNRRLDIYLWDNQGRKIIIENKIYAGDQYEQLLDYHKFAEKSTQQFKLIYLTLNGTEPSENSRKGLQRDQDFICLSYQQDISTWLSTCQSQVSNIPHLKQSIDQYLLNISFLTNQSMNQEYLAGIAKLLAKDQNYHLVNDIQNALTLLKINTLEALLKEIAQALKNQLALPDQEVFFMGKTAKIDQQKLKTLIHDYYHHKKVTQFGIGLRLSGTTIPNLALKIELNWSLYYGFALMNNNHELIPWNATLPIQASSGIFSTKDNPFLYRKEVAEEDKTYFHPDRLLRDSLDTLINENTRQKWINDFVEGIVEVLDLVRRNKSTV